MMENSTFYSLELMYFMEAWYDVNISPSIEIPSSFMEPVSVVM